MIKNVHCSLFPRFYRSLEKYFCLWFICRCVNNPLALMSHQLGLKMHTLQPRCDLFDGKREGKAKRRSPTKAVSTQCDKRMDFHFNALLDIIVEWRQAQAQDAIDCSLGGVSFIFELLYSHLTLTQLLRHCNRCGKSAVRIPFRSNHTMSPTTRHRCDVSSELCCPGAKPRRWASPLVTRFNVILRVK